MSRFEVIGDAAPAVNSEKEKEVYSETPSVPPLPSQSSKNDKIEELNKEKPNKKPVDLTIDD